ncbi:CapA family protein [Chloroflexota bacterium]
MQDTTIALTGDYIITVRISVVQDERFLSLVNLIRDADVGYGHLEMLLHDYEGPELYPALEAGWGHLRGPRILAEDLKWVGLDIVSHASNHSLDYSYGGMMSTWQALNKVGLPYAGTGMNLGEARQPAYADTPKGRVALISMCSSFAPWGGAGDVRPDMKGRPGVNPLRFHYQVDKEHLETIKKLATEMGWWVTNNDGQWILNPAGLHMTLSTFVESDEPGITAVVNEEDAEGNLRSISDASRMADWVIVHHHNHEWDPEVGMNQPPKFTVKFAKACIEAGADIFIAQGSHATMRGMELYKGKPIFYDPGDFITTIPQVTKYPSDYYLRPGHDAESHWTETPADVNEKHRALFGKTVNPPGGYAASKQPVRGSVVPICSFGEDKKLTGIKLYPFTYLREPKGHSGVPVMASGETAQELIDHMAKISTQFGTEIKFKDGVGVVKV